MTSENQPMPAPAAPAPPSLKEDLRRVTPILAIVLVTAIAVVLALRFLSIGFLHRAIIAGGNSCEQADLHIEAGRRKMETIGLEGARVRLEQGRIDRASLGDLEGSELLAAAREDFARAVELCPPAVSAYRYLSVIDWYSGDEARAYLNMALVHLRRNEDAEALPLLELARDSEPENVEVVIELARALQRLGRGGESRELVAGREESVAASPGGSGLLGALASASGELTEAREWLERALERNPVDLDSARLYRNVMMRLGEPEAGAEFLFQNSLAAPRAMGDTFHLASLLYKESGNAEMEERALRETLRLLPRHLEIRFELALLLHRQGKLNAAGDELTVAMEQNPDRVMQLIERRGIRPGEEP